MFLITSPGGFLEVLINLSGCIRFQSIHWTSFDDQFNPLDERVVSFQTGTTLGVRRGPKSGQVPSFTRFHQFPRGFSLPPSLPPSLPLKVSGSSKCREPVRLRNACWHPWAPSFCPAIGACRASASPWCCCTWASEQYRAVPLAARPSGAGGRGLRGFCT